VQFCLNEVIHINYCVRITLRNCPLHIGITTSVNKSSWH
jgi:hypothetical protein